jgi:hypothetical protein
MSDPRAGGLRAVRSSLRTLVYCCAASAVIELGTRGAFTFFLGRLRAGAWADYSVLGFTSTLSYAASIAVAVVSAMVIARLGALPARIVVPAKLTAAKAPPYRAAPLGDTEPTSTVETAPVVYALARWASVAAWGALGLQATSLAWSSLAGIFDDGSGSSLRLVDLAIVWLSTAVGAAAVTLLVVWMRRVARDLGVGLAGPLPVLLLAIVACRAGFWTWCEIRDVRLSEGMAWLTTSGAASIEACTALILAALGRGLAELPPEEEGGADPGEATWETASLGLAAYATAVKVRIALVLCGVGLSLLLAFSGEEGLGRGLLVLALVAGTIVGIAAIPPLVRYARLPDDTKAVGPARAAVGLFAVGSFADLCALVLFLRLLGDHYVGHSDRAGVGVRMAGVQMAGGALALGGILALLTSFSRLAVSMGDTSLVSRTRSFIALLGAVTVGSLGVGVAIAGVKAGDLELSLVLAIAIAMIVAAFIVLVKYLGLIGDMRLAMAARSGRKLA